MTGPVGRSVAPEHTHEPNPRYGRVRTFCNVFKRALAARTARLNCALSLRSARDVRAGTRGRSERRKINRGAGGVRASSSSASVKDRADRVKPAARTTTPGGPNTLSQFPSQFRSVRTLARVSAVTLASDYGESCARLNWLPDSYGSEG